MSGATAGRLSAYPLARPPWAGARGEALPFRRLPQRGAAGEDHPHALAHRPGQRPRLGLLRRRLRHHPLHALDPRREQARAPDPRPALEHRLPRRLGAGHHLHGGFASHAHPWRRQRLLLGAGLPHRLRPLALRHRPDAGDHRLPDHCLPDGPGLHAGAGRDPLALQSGARRQGPGRHPRPSRPAGHESHPARRSGSPRRSRGTPAMREPN